MKRLATLSVGDGHRAAIVERKDGSTYWSTGASRCVVEHPPLSFVKVPRGTLVAGETSPGSTSIEVRGADALRSVVKGGQFLALVAGEPRTDRVFVLFRDERGEIVRHEPGEVLKSKPLAADVQCPACGGTVWDKLEWRAEPYAPTARERAVVCRRCGHYDSTEPVGRRRSPERPDPPEAPSPLPGNPSAADIVRAARFPVYIPSRPPLTHVHMHAWSWDPDGLIGLSLRGTSVKVYSYAGSLPVPLADQARAEIVNTLLADLHGTFDDDIDVAMLERREARRRLDAAAEAAGSRVLSIAVSRRRREFVLVEYDGRWAAATEGIIVSGREVTPEDVALRRLRPDDELATCGGPGCS